MWHKNPLLPRAKFQVMNYLPTVGCSTRVGSLMARFCHSLSYPFRSGFLHICLMWRIIPPVFSFSLEATILYMAVDLAYPWEKVSSGSSYITILNQNLQFLTLFHSSIHPFNKYMSLHNVPGTGLSNAGISVNKTDIVPLSNAYSCGRGQTTAGSRHGRSHPWQGHLEENC